MAGLFLNENTAAGQSPDSDFQVGLSDGDPGTVTESGISLPAVQQDQATYLYYECAIECRLDSGIVVHRYLPQVDNEADSLSSINIADDNIDLIFNQGTNLRSNDDFTDVKQRMAHSVYRFRLFGRAMRAGYQIPIPGLVSIGDVDAIPDDAVEQVAFNRIAGNYAGVPLWYAEWSLWYTLLEPPAEDIAPTAPNLAAHIDADSDTADEIQSPFSQPDDDAQITDPTSSS